MSRLPLFVFGVITGAAMLYVATNYHVIRSSDGVEIIPKQSARLSEAYVDIRTFSMGDWASHPQLAAALVQANKQHLVGDSAVQALQQSVNQLVPNWPNR
jgi:hypothetical protein